MPCIDPVLLKLQHSQLEDPRNAVASMVYKTAWAS